MGKKEFNIVDRDVYLNDISVKTIKISDIEDYFLNIEYKITNIKDGNVNIKAKVDCGFIPESAFKANMGFNVFLEFDDDVTEEYITENINDILFPVASETNYLIAIITKSMADSSLVLTTKITECKAAVNEI